jgi:hypothetical protein
MSDHIGSTEETPASHEEVLLEEDSSRKTQRERLWETYCSLIRKYQPVLELADEAIDRLLFFTPSSSSGEGSSRWREVIWGILQLHRLALDLALNQNRRPIENSYGTSVGLVRPKIPATSIRIALTVLQSLGPVAQEIVRSRTHPDITLRRQSRIRAYLERMRFVLRMTLLLQYWRHVYSDNLKSGTTTGGESSSSSPSLTTIVAPGLLMDGGLFPSRMSAPTVTQERTRIEREQYTGRRTGRKVSRRTRGSGGERGGGLSSSQEQVEKGPPPSVMSQVFRTLLGELLYVLRPLLQAESEASSSSTPSKLRRTWVLTFFMDLASLSSLHSSAMHGNLTTREEWRRRRMRLLLYLLRAPIWDRYTQPVAERIGSAVEIVPLAGGLLSSYLWDWLYYWKLYRAEEG